MLSQDRLPLLLLTVLIVCITAFLFILKIQNVGFWGTYFAGGDDAHITYRTARNIAEGEGFGFNPGERVLITTTPLYTLLLAGSYFLIPNLAIVGGLIGLVSLYLGSVFIYLILKDVGAGVWSAFLGAASYLVSPMLLFILGMETSLLLAVILASFWLSMQNKPKSSIAMAAVATLIRPDAILVAAVLWSRRAFVERRFPWRESLVYLAILAPWLVFAQLYFGSFLPSSLGAKTAQGQGGYWWIFLTGIHTELGLWIPHWNALALLVGIPCAFGLVGHCKKLGCILAWIVLYSIAYRILAVPAYYWYYAPYFLTASLLLGAGLDFGTKPFGHLSPDARKRLKITMQAVGIAAVAFSLTSSVRIYAFDWHFQNSDNGRFMAYPEVGKWLAEYTKEDSEVAAWEIGFIGDISDRKIIDLCGLAQPEATEHIAQGDFLWLLRKYQPDYYVSWRRIEIFCLRERIGELDKYLQAGFSSVKEFKLAKGPPVRIYKRVDNQ